MLTFDLPFVYDALCQVAVTQGNIIHEHILSVNTKESVTAPPRTEREIDLKENKPTYENPETHAFVDDFRRKRKHKKKKKKRKGQKQHNRKTRGRVGQDDGIPETRPTLFVHVRDANCRDHAVVLVPTTERSSEARFPDLDC